MVYRFLNASFGLTSCNVKLQKSSSLRNMLSFFRIQINNCTSAEASLALSTDAGFRENISNVGSLQLYRDANPEEIQIKM